MLKYPVVAVDYDGTITIKDNYPNVGELNPLAIHYLKEYKKLGGKLILFTCRTDYQKRRKPMSFMAWDIRREN